MMRCKKCRRPMIRASMYDPEGTVPLCGGTKEYENGILKEHWVCINPGCSESQEGTK